MNKQTEDTDYLKFPVYFKTKGEDLIIREKVKYIYEWIQKSNNEEDSFNSFISLFIAFNMFYNLYALSKNPRIKLEGGDMTRALDSIKLLNKESFFDSNRSTISDFSKECEGFKVEVKLEGKSAKEDVSQKLSELVSKKDRETATKLSLDILYKTRCNLIHGEKQVNRSQENLLKSATVLLKAFLLEMLDSFNKELVKGSYM